MARVCAVCGKKPSTGNKVSHANNKSRRRWLPNLQAVRVMGPKGVPMKIRACTSCIHAGKIQKAPRGATAGV